MRTTVAIDDHLLAAAKDRARRAGLSLGQLIEEALRSHLGRAAPAGERPSIPVFRGGAGARPGVDTTSTRGLLEALDDGQPLERLQ